LGGTDPGEFSVIQTSITSHIAGGNSQNFTVKFSPISARAKTATLTISSNDSDEGTYTINLKGRGIKKEQSITFNALDGKTIGDAPFDLTAIASSGLAVSYVSSNTRVATISGITVTTIGAGTTEITASQAGDDTYKAAAEVKQTLTVSAAAVAETPLNNSTIVPNVFTPNGDDVNDNFFISAPNLVTIDFKIYDRYGRIVYETKDIAQITSTG